MVRCDEFFSLPLFPPASLCNEGTVAINNPACNARSGCGCCGSNNSCGGCGCNCGNRSTT